jgi:hypothetical protein
MPGPTTLSGRWATLDVHHGFYNNNVWNPSADGGRQAAHVWPSTSTFEIVQADNQVWTGIPAAYPTIVHGCHWGRCGPDIGLSTDSNPLKVGDLDRLQVTWQVEVPSSGAWNVAAEFWTHSEPVASGQADGAEVMIILDKRDVQPDGRKVDSVQLEGRRWEVWHTSDPGWDFVSYLAVEPTHRVEFDAATFLRDAVQRGYVNADHHVYTYQTGFEVWRGGKGLALTDYAVEVVRAAGGPTPDPEPEPAPMDPEPTLTFDTDVTRRGPRWTATVTVNGTDSVAYQWRSERGESGSGRASGDGQVRLPNVTLHNRNQWVVYRVIVGGESHTTTVWR